MEAETVKIFGQALQATGLVGFLYSIFGFNYGRHVDRRKLKDFIDSTSEKEDVLQQALVNDEVLTTKGKRLKKWGLITTFSSFAMIVVGGLILGSF